MIMHENIFNFSLILVKIYKVGNELIYNYDLVYPYPNRES